MALTRTKKKSRRSTSGGDCVEAGYADDALSTVAISDTKIEGVEFVIPTGAFGELLTRIKGGEFDRR